MTISAFRPMATANAVPNDVGRVRMAEPVCVAMAMIVVMGVVMMGVVMPRVTIGTRRNVGPSLLRLMFASPLLD